MRTVLYDYYFEPITILELSEFAVNHLNKYRSVRIPVPISPLTKISDPDSIPNNINFKTVTITCDILIKNNIKHMVLFTNDDENALLLKSAFLPGQRSQLSEIEKNAFAKGFIKACNLIGR